MCNTLHQQIEKAAAAREDVRVKGKQQGWDEDRCEDEARALKDKQHDWEDAEYDKQFMNAASGGLNYYFYRFCYALVQVCSQEQLLVLVHEGGLLSKLRGLQPQHSPGASMSFMMMSTLGPTIAMLTKDAARALELRQQGNAAFKQGELHQALAWYWQAAAINPGDAALLNNISLACLKQGDLCQALHAAEEAVKADPTLAKAWCRLGDAYRALGRWQLAHLAYTAARELAPKDPDLQARKADAASHLDIVWAVEDIPHPTRDMMSGAMFRWLGVTKAEAVAAMRSAGGDGSAPKDPDLQARKADAASHLDIVWAVEDIPHPTRDMMSGACSSMWNLGAAHGSGAIYNVVTGWL
eukprot:jgi/Sobl393_1/19530/SZX74190.1